MSHHIRCGWESSGFTVFGEPRMGKSWIWVQHIGQRINHSTENIALLHTRLMGNSANNTFWQESQSNCYTLLIFRYKWLAVNCAEKHSFICSVRVPACPTGFSFEKTITPSIGKIGSSCYRITDMGGRPDMTDLDAQGNPKRFMQVEFQMHKISNA